ncbi:sigma-70 family RNA polymerase sigma factor [Cytophagaceae bacterium ABcell3]|nr:sigma-70 family RNA polymerase sigma factor [Cytophagaceae bacterium ABcell3]
MKDQEVIERIRKGDEGALDYLYKKHYRMMVKLILKNSGNEEEAKDIYQEALIVLWQKVTDKNFILTSKISTFLYSICLNLWRKELERKSRHSNEEADVPEFMNIEQQERIDIINRCINSLGDTCQKILMYYYFDKLSMTDIADKMGFANADTAKTKKYKCKKELDKKVKSLFTASDFLD